LRKTGQKHYKHLSHAGLSVNHNSDISIFFTKAYQTASWKA